MRLAVRTTPVGRSDAADRKARAAAMRGLREWGPAVAVRQTSQLEVLLDSGRCLGLGASLGTCASAANAQPLRRSSQQV